MLEATITSFLGWVLLAGASFRFRRDLGITAPAMVQGLRTAGFAMLLIALFCCGAPLTGERFVRFLGAASLSGAVAVAILSVVPIKRLRR